jgi:hypothetical protein
VYGSRNLVVVTSVWWWYVYDNGTCMTGEDVDLMEKTGVSPRRRTKY